MCPLSAGPAEMLSALNGGSIDGFVWQEPFLTQAAKIAASARSGLRIYWIQCRGIGPDWRTVLADGSGGGGGRHRPDGDRTVAGSTVMKARMMIDQANWAIAEGIARPGSVVPDYSDYLDPTLLVDARRS
jgi:hypothetical protein